jgi:aldehyde dehydrogenase (NAD+)
MALFELHPVIVDGLRAGDAPFQQFIRWQAMNWDYSGRLQKAQMDVAGLSADLDFKLTA